MATPQVDPEEQRRLAELEAARTSQVFFQAGPVSTSASAGMTSPGLAGVGTGAQPGSQTAQDRQLAFLNAPIDPRTISADRTMAPELPFVPQQRAVISPTPIPRLRSPFPRQ